MSFKSRDDRIREAQKAQAANSQRPGGSEVAPRQRRAAEAELLSAQRVGRGQEIDDDGRQQVRTDQSIRIDRRNRHQVDANVLRFDTPVDASQAATKAYVDAALEDVKFLGDSEAVGRGAQTVPTTVLFNTGWTQLGFVVDDYYNNVVSSTDTSPVYTVGAHPGIGGVNAIELAPGYYYQISFSVELDNSTAQVALQYSNDDADTSWSTYNRQVTTLSGDSLYPTGYILLDNEFGAYKYIMLAVRDNSTANSLEYRGMHFHLRRLAPHYSGGYAALPTPPPTPAPEADFVADQTSISPRTRVNFVDLSTGHVSSWSWTFGDGNTSTSRNPNNVYMSTGTYTVVLTVTGDGGSDTETKTSYITVA